MAVPAGDYRVACSLDASPIFPPLACEVPVRIESPPRDAFERRLREFSSEDPHVRQRAIDDIGNFSREGARAVPALIAVLDGPHLIDRTSALWALRRFPEEASPYWARVFAVLLDDASAAPLRYSAAWCLADIAPWDDRVDKALAAAVDGEGQPDQGPVSNYRARHGR